MTSELDTCSAIAFTSKECRLMDSRVDSDVAVEISRQWEINVRITMHFSL